MRSIRSGATDVVAGRRFYRVLVASGEHHHAIGSGKHARNVNSGVTPAPVIAVSGTRN
jgi:hypothetical protein